MATGFVQRSARLRRLGIGTQKVRQQIAQFGGKVGRHSHLSADLSSASAQIPVQLQQMRSAGVNLVLLAANPVLATQFVHEASTQRFAVKYAGSDWAAMSSQPGQANMPAFADQLSDSEIDQVIKYVRHFGKTATK